LETPAEFVFGFSVIFLDLHSVDQPLHCAVKALFNAVDIANPRDLQNACIKHLADMPVKLRLGNVGQGARQLIDGGFDAVECLENARLRRVIDHQKVLERHRSFF
jgi:hypothetical protein